MCTFSKVHKIFKTALAACHIILLACSSTQCCHKLEKTVVTGLVMVITLGELLFWLASKARCSQKVCYPLFARTSDWSHHIKILLSSVFLGDPQHNTYTCMVSTFWLCRSHFFQIFPVCLLACSPIWCRGQKLNEEMAISKWAFSLLLVTQEFRGVLWTGNTKSAPFSSGLFKL